MGAWLLEPTAPDLVAQAPAQIHSLEPCLPYTLDSDQLKPTEPRDGPTFPTVIQAQHCTSPFLSSCSAPAGKPQPASQLSELQMT